MYENRIKHLEEAHRALDKQIETLERTGNFTDQRLTDLKKHKLTVKDEIAILKRKQWEHDHETIHYDDDER
jgi:uncharacterized protein YdcH (DUF465 family)